MKNAFLCLIEFGLTKVICSVTIEEKFQDGKSINQGWLTAEYLCCPHLRIQEMTENL